MQFSVFGFPFSVKSKKSYGESRFSRYERIQTITYFTFHKNQPFSFSKQQTGNN